MEHIFIPLSYSSSSSSSTPWHYRLPFLLSTGSAELDCVRFFAEMGLKQREKESLA